MHTIRSRFSHTASTIALTLSLGACASVNQDSAFQDMRATLGERVNQELVWRGDAAADAETTSKVDALLAKELTLDAAVQLALFNSRALQARYADVGIAKADLIAAGLLSNPVLDVMIRPTTNPSTGANLEFGLAQSILDIFKRPARQRVAQAEFERTQNDVAAAVVGAVAHVREAYVGAVGALNGLAVVKEVSTAAVASYELAQQFHKAGNISDLQLAEEQSMAEDSAAMVDAATLQAAEATEALAAILNVSPEAVKLPSQLPALPEQDATPSNLETLALDKRLDIAAARKTVAAGLENLKLKTDWRLWQEIGLSFSAERDGDKQWAIGPSLEIALPLFNQGGPDVTRAAAELFKAENELKDLQARVRSEVRSAGFKASTARRIAERYRKTILPLKQDIVRLKQEKYNYMLIGVFDVLVAKREETTAYLSYIDAVRNYWLARAELANAIGGAPVDTGPTATGAQP
ncbi:MAG: TolC family protein [Rhodospirillaceae bacterium]|nr:TolC family protein [Rhodospirillaceae bacterium]